MKRRWRADRCSRPLIPKARPAFRALFDAPSARKVAEEAQRALAEGGFGDALVKLDDYTNWPKAKPKPGIIELWIGEPTEGHFQ